MAHKKDYKSIFVTKINKIKFRKEVSIAKIRRKTSSRWNNTHILL